MAAATVVSREGPFVSFGSRFRVETFRYLLEYDGQRHSFQWRTYYKVGDPLRLIYDRAHPSVVRVLGREETGREEPRIRWQRAAWVVASALIGIISLWAGFRSVPSEPRPRNHPFSSIK